MLIKFVCNICSKESEKDSSELGREDRSCNTCGSIGRWRSIVYCVSQVLFGRALTIPEMPVDKSIVGIGLSDTPLYADALAEKFSYTNTYPNRDPQLDITQVSHDTVNSLDFLIASDVFEHIAPPVSVAFRNACKMLKDSGSFIFSVPFKPDGDTQEWFPTLNQYEVVDFFGKPILINRTTNSGYEVHRNLCFHGSDRETLEMRLFSFSGIIAELNGAGFHYISILDEDIPQVGIFNRNQLSVPLVASRMPIRGDTLNVIQPTSLACT